MQSPGSAEPLGLRVLDGEPDPDVPSGPRAPGTVQSLRWFRDPVAFMERNGAAHDDAFSVRLGPLKRCTFISDSTLGWTVLSGSPELMRMGSTNGIFRPVLGDSSLFLLDGAEHKRHRRLIMPAFHRGAVRRFSSLVAELTARDIATWPDDQAFPLQERLRGITLNMIFRVVVGIAGAERDERMRELIRDLLDMVQNPIAVLPWFQRDLGGRSPFARLMKVVDEIEALLYEEIGERRYDPTTSDRDDVLSMLVRPQTHEDGFMSDREIRDELLTLLIAGHETTATAISWTFERLLRHPNAVERLTDELERGVDDPYLDAVMRETLRLRPVLPITARKLTKPIELGKWTFPAGWTLMPCMYLMHRDPDVFPDPEHFRPERFLQEPLPSSRVWVPFGAGPRHCIGSGLSVMAIKVIVRTVLTRARLIAANPDDERVVRRNFTLGPEHGASVVLTRRLQPGRRVAIETPAGGRPAR